MRKLKGFPVGQWQEYERKQEYGKTVVTVAIGVDMDAKEYITEDIYEDVLKNILSKKYRVFIDVFSVPGIVVTYKNRIIHHNPDVSDRMTLLRAILEDVSINDKMVALTDFVENEYYGQPLNKAARKIKDTVRVSTESNYNYKLIYETIKAEVMDEIDKKCDIPEGVKDLDDNTLLKMASQLDAEPSIKDEVWKRYVCGIIK